MCILPRSGLEQRGRHVGLVGNSPYSVYAVIRTSVHGYTTCAHDCSYRWKDSIVLSEKQVARYKRLIRHGREEAEGYSGQGSKTQVPFGGELIVLW